MEALSNAEDFSMSLRMYSQIFYSKMIELVDKHFRTYREMMAGKTCYYETVFYKIGNNIAEYISMCFHNYLKVHLLSFHHISLNSLFF